jgi:Lysozyme like domain
MTICGPNQQLTRDQVAQYMRNAGFPEQNIGVGLAIAFAESGLASGNCNLDDPNGGSFGLWQINGAHFNSGGTSKECAFDPQCSTNYAFKLWVSQGWDPWGTYTSGAYKQYLNGFPDVPGKNNADCQCPPGWNTVMVGGEKRCQKGGDIFPCGQTVEPGKDPLTTIGDTLTKLGPWISDPVRVVKMIAGIVFIAGAIFLVASPQGQIAQLISKSAGKVGIH